MKNRLSDWARNISPSPTLAVDAKAKALKAAGKDVCGFGTGEPDFDTPAFIKDDCVKALLGGATKYINSAGLPELRSALADMYNEKKNLKDIKATNMIVCPGGKFACYLSILAVCGIGDEIIIPAPYWVSYPEMAKLAGAKPVFVYSDDTTDFKPTVESIEKAITPNTKLLILNSPSNPTGSVYTREELKAIADLAIRHDFFVLSDEIYENLAYDGVTTQSIAAISEEMQQRTIVASGFSKSYAMTGWRLGTVCAPDDIAKAVANLQSQTTSNATTFAQYGALSALKNADKAKESIKAMLQKFDERRRKMLAGLNAIDGITCNTPKGAFYLFPNISAFKMSSSEFCSKLLEEELMAIVPGVAFGADNYVRFSYAVSDTVIEKGLERIARFCAKLSK
ncbi:MAG: pyridoxal phosphate-dependent aminotransferase [Opitutales bacterium]|nr:pyridoxal phosphate-dependent aminotransferase [Opitutales bacterium]